MAFFNISKFSKPKLKLIRPDFPSSITIKEISYQIEVLFIKKKNSSVTISETIIKFRLSDSLSNKQAQNHFEELFKKIHLKLLKSKISPENKISFKQIYDQNGFHFHNQNYYFQKTSTKGIKFIDNNTIRINQNLTLEQIKKGITKLLISKYTPILENHLKQLNSVTYNYKISGFHLNSVKSKWGHCTHDNKIMLNLKLLNADIDTLNYVIFHEISHIKQKNHSSKFWAEVGRFCPNHKQIKQKLKNNPPKLFLELKNTLEN